MPDFTTKYWVTENRRRKRRSHTDEMMGRRRLSMHGFTEANP
ncbi:MAG TPA: hypothetical protein VK249_27335 [Anaerolineales bacterium]|nr:hypothetical protein [Anaerolineales bacterium]